MNKQLQAKTNKLESLKSREIEKRDKINDVINDMYKQLKVLYDYQKQQEKIYQLQQELDGKIKEQ